MNCGSGQKKSKKYHISIEEKDLDDIASFLQTQGLVRTSQGAIRITQNFADRFHRAYHAWLTF